MSIYISNPKEVERKLSGIKTDGAGNLQILTDFDRTITRALVDGKPVPPIMQMLRDGTYISSEYAAAATELAKKYKPIEMDLTIPESERITAMNEWWTEHFALLIKSGLNKKHLQQIVSDERFQFRQGALETLDLLNKMQIPLVVISSSGLGETIPMLFEKCGKLYGNIYVITNEYNWDANGKALGMKTKTIHCMNKDESALRTLPQFSKIQHRKNVILLGDSVGDLKMIGDFDYKNLLTIGFLDENMDANRLAYQKAFDVVLEGDEDFRYLNDLLKETK